MKVMKKISNNKILAFMFLIISLSILVMFMSGGILGNDFWWHIKVGEYISNTGVVPQIDIFSWYGVENNLEWTAHEWLGDVILHKVFSLGGETAVFCVCILGAVAFNTLIWFEVKKYIHQRIGFITYYLIALSVTSSLFFYGRPQMFGFFFVFEELKILFDFIDGTRKENIYLIPIIAVLWSNIYGGSSNLSYIICCIFILGSLLNFQYGKIEGVKLERKELLMLSIVTICTIAAITINPIGLKVLTYPYVNLSDSISMNFISEWKAPDAKLIGNLLLFFFPIATTVLGFIHNEKKIKFLDLLLSAVFILLFLRSVRFIILWYIVAAFASVKYLPQGPKINFEGNKINVILIFATIISMLPLCVGVASVYQTCKDGNQIAVAMNDEAVEFVKKYNPKRIFNDYDLGETLIYNDIPVFFDARADLYSESGILQDGLELMSMQPLENKLNNKSINVNALIEQYDFDCVLVKKSRPLYVYLSSNPDTYSLIYEDESIGLFEVKRK